MKRYMQIPWFAALAALGAGSSGAVAQHDHSGHKHAEKEAPKAEALCPIMGEPVNLSVSTRTDDGPVFFCCPGCIKKYEATPQKFADKVAEQRKALAGRPKVQVACPVNGDPVDQKIALDHDGGKVFFCGTACQAKFETAPKKFAVNLANSYSYQARCPVTGGPINPMASSVLPTGETVYYCCPMCAKKLLDDPAKYAPKLAEQGVRINVDKLLKALEGK